MALCWATGAAGHVADETSEAFVMPAQLQQYQEAGQQQPHLPYMAPQMAFEPGNEPLVAQPPFGHVVTSGLPARPLAKDDANNPLDRPSAGSTVRDRDRPLLVQITCCKLSCERLGNMQVQMRKKQLACRNGEVIVRRGSEGGGIEWGEEECGKRVAK